MASVRPMTAEMTDVMAVTSLSSPYRLYTGLPAEVMTRKCLLCRRHTACVWVRGEGGGGEGWSESVHVRLSQLEVQLMMYVPSPMAAHCGVARRACTSDRSAAVGRSPPAMSCSLVRRRPLLPLPHYSPRSLLLASPSLLPSPSPLLRRLPLPPLALSSGRSPSLSLPHSLSLLSPLSFLSSPSPPCAGYEIRCCNATDNNTGRVQQHAPPDAVCTNLRAAVPARRHGHYMGVAGYPPALNLMRSPL